MDNRGFTTFPKPPKQEVTDWKLSGNQFTTFEGMTTIPTLKVLRCNQTRLLSFKGAIHQPSLEALDFSDTPLANSEFCTIMAVIAFGDQLKFVNHKPITPAIINCASANRLRLLRWIRDGWIITSFRGPIMLYNTITHQRQSFYVIHSSATSKFHSSRTSSSSRSISRSTTMSVLSNRSQPLTNSCRKQPRATEEAPPSSIESELSRPDADMSMLDFVPSQSITTPPDVCDSISAIAILSQQNECQPESPVAIDDDHPIDLFPIVTGSDQHGIAVTQNHDIVPVISCETLDSEAGGDLIGTSACSDQSQIAREQDHNTVQSPSCVDVKVSDESTSNEDVQASPQIESQTEPAPEADSRNQVPQTDVRVGVAESSRDEISTQPQVPLPQIRPTTRDLETRACEQARAIAFRAGNAYLDPFLPGEARAVLHRAEQEIIRMTGTVFEFHPSDFLISQIVQIWRDTPLAQEEYQKLMNRAVRAGAALGVAWASGPEVGVLATSAMWATTQFKHLHGIRTARPRRIIGLFASILIHQLVEIRDSSAEDQPFADERMLVNGFAGAYARWHNRPYARLHWQAPWWL
jgi:hypothetical protein